MWNDAESEVVRVGRVLAHNNVSGEALLHKFRSASREDVHLAAALRGYFLDDTVTDDKKVYLEYLSRRIRPAVTALIESNRVTELMLLEQQGLFTSQLTDEFLRTAIEMNRGEILVWLLQLKQERFGFRDRDFRL